MEVVYDQASGPEWFALVDPLNLNFTDYDSFITIATHLKRFNYVAEEGVVNMTLFREQAFFEEYNYYVMNATNPSVPDIDFTKWWQGIGAQVDFYQRWDNLTATDSDQISIDNFEQFGLTEDEFLACDRDQDNYCLFLEQQVFIESLTLFNYYSFGSESISPEDLLAAYTPDEVNATDANFDGIVNRTEWFRADQAMNDFYFLS